MRQLGNLQLAAAAVVLAAPLQVSFSLNRFVKFIGPGLLMSIAYVVSSGEQQ